MHREETGYAQLVLVLLSILTVVLLVHLFCSIYTIIVVLSYFLMYATQNKWTVVFPNSTLGFQGGDGADGGWNMNGGQCLNKFSNCDENDILCHYISPRHMHMVHDRISSSTQ